MAKDVEWYERFQERERRRVAKFQVMPEFVEWVAATPADVAVFVEERLPQHRDDPWSEQALADAEALALELFPTMVSANASKTPENARIIEQFVRYLGQGLVERYEARWVYADEGIAGGLEPSITDDYSMVTYFPPRWQLTATADRRTGRQWRKIYGNRAKGYERWVAAGRPPKSVWAKAHEDGLVS